MDPVHDIAEALGTVVGRSFRLGVYREITKDVAAGLTERTYPILSAVARAGAPTSAAAIASEVGLDRSVVSRRAAALATAGLLAREAGPDDARQALLSLTPTGSRAIQHARERLHNTIRRHVADWSTSDRETFAELFQRFAAQPLHESEPSEPTAG